MNENIPSATTRLTEAPLKIEHLRDRKKAPFWLLKLADPSLIRINDYLDSGSCYTAKLESEIIGVMVLDKIGLTTIEIKNIAIKETVQGVGFGKILLRYAEKISRESGYEKLIIGTGNSSIGQLALYQKEGFEMRKVEIDFFLKNYAEPIFENGIQCKHMVILEKNLTQIL